MFAGNLLSVPCLWPEYRRSMPDLDLAPDVGTEINMCVSFYFRIETALPIALMLD